MKRKNNKIKTPWPGFEPGIPKGTSSLLIKHTRPLKFQARAIPDYATTALMLIINT